MSGRIEDDVVRRGQALYEQKIRAVVDEPENRGKMLVINVETGEYEMDDDDVVAARRAKARFGDAALFSSWREPRQAPSAGADGTCRGTG